MNQQFEAAIEITESKLKAIKREDLRVRFDAEEEWQDGSGFGAVVIDDSVYIAPCQIAVSTILGTKTVPGWEVYTFRMFSNYPHAPDDVDIVSLGDERSITAAIKIAVLHILSEEMDAAE
jgi:hypothetical protein